MHLPVVSFARWGASSARRFTFHVPQSERRKALTPGKRGRTRGGRGRGGRGGQGERRRLLRHGFGGIVVVK
eukprot:2677709-Pyramimonas_sp.AAC.1